MLSKAMGTEAGVANSNLSLLLLPLADLQQSAHHNLTCKAKFFIYQ